MSLLLVSSWCRFFDLTAVDCRLSGRGIIWLDIWWEMFFAYAVKQSVAASTVYLYVSMNTWRALRRAHDLSSREPVKTWHWAADLILSSSLNTKEILWYEWDA